MSLMRANTRQLLSVHMPKTIEATINGKLVKFSGSITKLDKDTIAFSLFNDCGEKWEWGLMKSNGMEHYMPDAAAVGLTFNKTSAKTMAEVLKYIAEELERQDDYIY